MLAIWVKVRIKPELRQRFLDAIEVDALSSERDEPGCSRFNALQDAQDPNVYDRASLHPRTQAVWTVAPSPRA